MRRMFKDLETVTVGSRGARGARLQPAGTSALVIDSSGQTAEQFIVGIAALMKRGRQSVPVDVLPGRWGDAHAC